MQKLNSAKNESPLSNKPVLAAWLATAIMIPLLSAFGRPLQNWAYEHIGNTTSTWIISLLLITLGVMAVRWLAKQELNSSFYILIMVTVIIVLLFVAIISYLPRSEERLHFFTFGLFGFFSKRLLPTWVALLSIAIWSGADELFQAWLPDRVGDWRDVGMNLTASLLGASIAFIGIKFKSKYSHKNNIA
jgi:hypothetical protein